MTHTPQLRTVEEVIDAFGGVRAMRDLFGGGPSRFSNFKASGRFPERLHHKIYKAALKRGLNIADELLGGEEQEPQRELPLMAAE
jgi:hypothetical protein